MPRGGLLHEGLGALLARVQLGDQPLREAGHGAAAQAQLQRALERAHVQHDGALRGHVLGALHGPVAAAVAPEDAHRLGHPSGERLTRRVRQEVRLEEVRALAIAHDLEVAVVVGVHDGRDGDALGVVHLVVLGAHPDDGLAVGAHEVAHAVGQARQALWVRLHGQQERHGAQHAAREHHVVGAEVHVVPVFGGALGLEHVAPTRELTHGHHLGLRAHHAAQALGQVQVVEVESVLGAHAAARHARAALDAAHARRALPVEVRVRHLLALLALLAEVDGHARLLVVVGAAQVRRDLAHDPIANLVTRVGLGAQHAGGRVVVGRELALPVRQVLPRLGPEEVVLGRGVRARIDQRAAAHAHAVHHGHVIEEAHLEDPFGPHLRPPVPALEVGVVGGEVLAAEAQALLQHQHAVALLAQAKR